MASCAHMQEEESLPRQGRHCCTMDTSSELSSVRPRPSRARLRVCALALAVCGCDITSTAQALLLLLLLRATQTSQEQRFLGAEVWAQN